MRTRLLMLFVAAIAMSSCVETSDLTKIEMPFNQQIIVPANPKPDNTIELATPEIKTNLDSVFTKYDIENENLIQSISLDNMELELILPENSDLSFIKDIEVSISVTGLTDVVIVKSTDVAESQGKKLVLQIQNVALKEFLLKEKFKLKFKITTKKALEEMHLIDLKFKFILDLKVIGF